MVVPVARATLLSLFCISCVLHVYIHPDRSARFARCARSLAALALPSWAVLGPSCAVLGHLGAILRRLGAYLARLGAILSRLGGILGRLSVILASQTPTKIDPRSIPRRGPT